MMSLSKTMGPKILIWVGGFFEGRAPLSKKIYTELTKKSRYFLHGILFFLKKSAGNLGIDKLNLQDFPIVVIIYQSGMNNISFM